MTCTAAKYLYDGRVLAVVNDKQVFFVYSSNDVAAPAADVTAWVAAGNVITPYVAPTAAVDATGNLAFIQFMELFAKSEQAAIVLSADPQIKLFTLMSAGSPSISLSDSVVINGVNYLVSAGILTQARADAILTGKQPA